MAPSIFYGIMVKSSGPYLRDEFCIKRLLSISSSGLKRDAERTSVAREGISRSDNKFIELLHFCGEGSGGSGLRNSGVSMSVTTGDDEVRCGRQ